MVEFKLHQSKRNLLYLHRLLQWPARYNKTTFFKGNPAGKKSKEEMKRRYLILGICFQMTKSMMEIFIMYP